MVVGHAGDVGMVGEGLGGNRCIQLDEQLVAVAPAGDRDRLVCPTVTGDVVGLRAGPQDQD